MKGEVVMTDESGACHRDVALIVPPMVRHRMSAAPYLRTWFIEPQCSFAAGLRERCGAGITAAGDLRGLREEDVQIAGAPQSSGTLDPRLLAAMEALARRDIQVTGAAVEAGLSPQRLRALARRQLGMPLARWRIWRRLTRAARALVEGQSIAEAAITGGFADQAHFSRRLREMMGLTPTAVLPMLRPSAARSDVDGD
ncbi:AraC family transcriptional regulator [Streptosporangium carneum]|uniref:AraC family transcriptional regulator n=1 Tax=Streptosporangium carneum TaxID=47481 RepID=UPI0022F33F64|nr:helix-turn-helix domain-containing protein [Streptosporangium carneum]